MAHDPFAPFPPELPDEDAQFGVIDDSLSEFEYSDSAPSLAIILISAACGVGFGIMGAANGKRTAAAAKAQAMANSQVSPGDFPRLTTEAYVSEVADRYNAGISAPPPPPKDTKKKKPKR